MSLINNQVTNTLILNRFKLKLNQNNYMENNNQIDGNN